MGAGGAIVTDRLSQGDGTRRGARGGDLGGRSKDNYRQLLRLLREIVDGQDLAAILQDTAGLLARTLQPGAAAILSLRKGTRIFRIEAMAGPPGGIRRRLTISPAERLATARVLRTCRLLVVPDFNRAGRTVWRAAARAQPRVSAIMARIEGPSGPFGVLMVRSGSPHVFGAGEVALVKEVADLLSRLTKRLQTVSNLRDSEKQYRLLVDSSPDIVYRLRLKPSLRVEYISPSVRSLTGYTPNEFYADARLVRRILHPDFRSGLRSRLAHPEQHRPAEQIGLLRRDGRRVWVSVARTSIYDRNGQLAGEQGIVREVSDGVVVSEQLRAAAEATVAILDGHQLDATLRIIVRHLRYVLDAQQTAIVAASEDGRALRIVAVDSVAGARGREGETIRPTDPLLRRALRSHRRLMVDGTIVTPIPWTSQRLGLLIARGVAGGRPSKQRAASLVDQFARQAALAVEYLRAHQERQRLAVLEDRSRIARELHDGVVQSLFGVALTLQMNHVSPREVKDAASRAGATVRGVIEDIQNYVLDLEPAILLEGGLVQALKRVTRAFEASSGIAVRVETNADALATLEGLALQVLQIVREALSNVVRHARARNCWLRVHRARQGTVLEVRDDGVGFRTDGPHGVGMRNLRERARSMGGKLELVSKPDQGSTVRVTIPRVRSRPAQDPLARLV